MRYVVCVVVGMAFAIAGVALIAGGVYEVARVGTCAVGGAYQIARPCPDGMEIDILKLIGGISAALVGVAVYAARGTGAVMGRGRGFAGAVWGMGFLGVAFAIWTSVHGDGALAGDDSGVATWLTIMFAVMGAVPLLISLFLAFLGRPTPDPTAQGFGQLARVLAQHKAARDAGRDHGGFSSDFSSDDADRDA